MVFLGVPDDVFGLTDDPTDSARGLFDLAIGLELPVAGHPADRFLYSSFDLLGVALDTILVHLSFHG